MDGFVFIDAHQMACVHKAFPVQGLALGHSVCLFLGSVQSHAKQIRIVELDLSVQQESVLLNAHVTQTVSRLTDAVAVAVLHLGYAIQQSIVLLERSVKLSVVLINLLHCLVQSITIVLMAKTA